MLKYAYILKKKIELLKYKNIFTLIQIAGEQINLFFTTLLTLGL
jgi:hypothetical protein